MADQVSVSDLCNARAIRDCIRDHASELYDGTDETAGLLHGTATEADRKESK